MRNRARNFTDGLLPRSWLDVAFQILLFCGAYVVYRIVRGMTEGQAGVAFENAREIISIEKSMGLFFEPAVHTWAAGNKVLIDVASWIYLNSHFTLTILTLAFIYLYRNDSFYFVRNMFMVAMGISLVLYALYPTAPPRFLPELGFADPLADVTGIPTNTGPANMLFNAYAAVPSMHVGFALMVGLPMARLVKREAAQIFWWIYPAIVTFTVIATANHWWIDAVLGALTTLVSILAAMVAARFGPASWKWSPRTSSKPIPATTPSYADVYTAASDVPRQ